MSVARCSNCNHVLTADEQRDGWCEACGKRLVKSSLSSPASGAKAERESPPSLIGHTNDSVLGWCSVRTGLTQLLAGQLLVLFGIGGGVLLYLAATAPGAADRDGPSTGSVVFTPLCIAAVFVGAVLMAAGIVMTCAVPEESRARLLGGLATFFLALSVLAVLVSIAVAAENDRASRASFRRSLRLDQAGSTFRPAVQEEMPSGPAMIAVLRYGATVAVLLCQLFLTLFLTRVAAHFGSRVLTGCLLTFLVVWMLASAVNLGMTLLSDKMDDLWWIILAVGVGIYLVFMALVLAVRQTVVRGLMG
jgi:hypothetical protein